MSEEHGGPAFPCKTPGEYYTGMSLRDWFAGQALTGMELGKGDSFTERAALAYEYADAMLKERAK